MDGLCHGLRLDRMEARTIAVRGPTDPCLGIPYAIVFLLRTGTSAGTMYDACHSVSRERFGGRIESVAENRCGTGGSASGGASAGEDQYRNLRHFGGVAGDAVPRP